MPYLILQVAALMLAAYFLGAMTGCLLRRLFYVPAPRADVQSGDWAQAGMAPAIATAAVGAPMIQVGRETASLGTAGSSSRFERALSQAPEAAPQLETIAPMDPPPPPPPLAQSVDLPPEPVSEVTPEPYVAETYASTQERDEADVEIVVPTEDPLVFEPEAEADPDAATPYEADTSYRQSATAAAAAAAATVGAGYVLGRAESTSDASDEVAPPPELPADFADETDLGVELEPARVPQDLTRIKFIDAAVATELNNRGITRFEDLAEIDLAGLNAIESDLGMSGRPDRERWVAQAGRLARGEAVDDIVATIPQASVLPNDLTRISSVDAVMASRLNNRGITRFDDLANMHPDDITSLDADLGLDGRVRREQWQAQAYRLSRGQPTDDLVTPVVPQATGSVPAVPRPAAAAENETDFGSDISSGTETDPVSPTDPARSNADQAAIAATGVAAATAAATRASGAGNWSDREPRDPTNRRPPAIEVAPEMPPPPPATNPADLDAPPRPAKLGEAIKDNTGQVSGFRESEKSASLSSISTLRSVRSEALAGRTKRDGAGDDLKRIRGIGVLIEKKLNSLGITNYEQIANWTDDDVRHFSSKLDFKGRIEREHWIEQARILTSGG